MGAHTYTEGLSVDADEETGQTRAMFTVVVDADSPTAAMKAATSVLEMVEGFEGATTLEDGSSATRRGTDGESDDSESDGTSEPGYTVHDDGIVRIEFDGDRHNVSITTDTRTYQVLYHIHHYRAKTGKNTFRTADVAEMYDHLNRGEITPSLSNLQRVGFIEKTGTDGDGAPVYRIEGGAIRYVDKHGKPTKYRLPE